jgi:fatty acid desaturase
MLRLKATEIGWCVRMDADLASLLAELRAKEPPRRPRVPLRARLRRVGPPLALLLALCVGCLVLFPWWVLPLWFALGIIAAVMFAVFVRMGRRDAN